MSLAPAYPPGLDGRRRARRARGWLGAYLVAVVALGFVHHAGLLAAGLAAAVLLGGAGRLALLRRTLRAVLLFNVSVSAGYALIAWWGQRLQVDVLLLLNLRVVLLVYLGFWFVARVDLLQALSFSPTASFVVALAVGQVATFSRVLREFRLAFVSRNPVPPGLANQLHHASAQATHLLDAAIARAAENSMAMRSRGCFDAPPD